MLKTDLRKIARLRDTIARTQATISSQLPERLRALPSEFGFASPRELIRAIRAASRGGYRSKANPTTRLQGKKRRKRATITDATRAAVKKLTEAGKSGSEVAREVGISLPSVQNIRKALGLVRARK